MNFPESIVYFLFCVKACLSVSYVSMDTLYKLVAQTTKNILTGWLFSLTLYP